MKICILNIIFMFFIISCTTSPKNYEGYIYNIKKQPLVNIKVCEQKNNTCTYTNDKGFFRLTKDKTSISDLIIFHGNKPIDTIKTVWSQHGEKINYSFLEGKKDTLFIDIK